MDDMKAALGRHPFFVGVPESVVAGALRQAEFLNWKKDEVIFRKGGRAHSVYLIRRGRVAVEMPAPDRGPVHIQWVRSGEVLGWSWLLPPYRWRFDARAHTATRAIALPAAWMRTQCRRVPRLGNRVMKHTADIIMNRWTRAVKRRLDAGR